PSRPRRSAGGVPRSLDPVRPPAKPDGAPHDAGIRCGSGAARPAGARHRGATPAPGRRRAHMTTWIRWFGEIGMQDVPSVGGRNASLGEMRRALTPLGIRTPDGFATTADAYRAFLSNNDLEAVIREALGGL